MSSSPGTACPPSVALLQAHPVVLQAHPGGLPCSAAVVSRWLLCRQWQCWVRCCPAPAPALRNRVMAAEWCCAADCACTPSAFAQSCMLLNKLRHQLCEAAALGTCNQGRLCRTPGWRLRGLDQVSPWQARQSATLLAVPPGPPARQDTLAQDSRVCHRGAQLRQRVPRLSTLHLHWLRM